MYHSTKKGEKYRPQVKMFQWSLHNEECCPVCEHITAVEKGGGEAKEDQERVSQFHFLQSCN